MGLPGFLILWNLRENDFPYAINNDAVIIIIDMIIIAMLLKY